MALEDGADTSDSLGFNQIKEMLDMQALTITNSGPSITEAISETVTVLGSTHLTEIRDKEVDQIVKRSNRSSTPTVEREEREEQVHGQLRRSRSWKRDA